MVCSAVIDYIQDSDQKVIIVETDNSNPDVAKAYADSIETASIDLDTADGWLQIIDICENNPESIVVVNTAARNNLGVEKFGANLNGVLSELGRELIALWVINRQRDSIELLIDFEKAISNAKVHVLRNELFGDQDKFELYNNSNIRNKIEAKGGKSVMFPAVADRVADAINAKRYSIKKALTELSIANRSELRRWKNEVAVVLKKLIA
jgi:hypothetical protein